MSGLNDVCPAPLAILNFVNMLIENNPQKCQTALRALRQARQLLDEIYSGHYHKSVRRLLIKMR